MPHIAAASPHFRCDSQPVAVDVVRVSLSGEIALSGEIDVSDAQAIDEVLSGAQAGAALTILDLRGLSAIEPTLLELVTAAGVRTREQGRRLVILHGPSAPRAEFEGSGLDARIMTIEEPPPLAQQTAQDAKPPPSVDLPDSFEVATEEHSDRAVIKVFGELDIATGPELATALARQAAQCRSILLDLRGVEFMESTGLHLLIQARERARHDGLGFELITSKAVDRTLETAAHLPRCPTISAA